MDTQTRQVDLPSNGTPEPAIIPVDGNIKPLGWRVQRTRTDAAQQLRERIETKQAVMGVVGLGYVGLPLAIAYNGNGFRSLGVDLNTERVLRLNAGHNHVADVNDGEFRKAVDDGLFEAVDEFGRIGEADVIFVCVPTPVTNHKDPDTSYIESAARSIASHLREGQLIVLKSTTYPNTTEGLVKPILEAEAQKRGFRLGHDYFLAFSPERIDPGNSQFATSNTPVVVGGVTAGCTEMATLALQQIVSIVHPVSSPKVAEMEKLLENTFRSVNIALVNELARLCDRMGGISMWEVVDAAATKPFGFMPFYPGPGLGGHCIPVDPYYLSWLARRYDFETGFITLSARTNEDMPFYVADLVVRTVARLPVTLSDANVLVLGVTFKRDVDDIRHSPALRVLELLHSKGVRRLSYSDPYVPELSIKLGDENVNLTSEALTPELLGKADVAVILTDHRAFPYEEIAQHAAMVVDTRNALKSIPHDPEKVVLLGGG